MSAGARQSGRLARPARSRRLRITVTLGTVALLTGGVMALLNSQKQPSAPRRVSSAEMIELLTRSLPDGATSQAKGAGGDSPTGPSAEVMFDAGTGAGKVRVQVGRLPVPVPANLSDCFDRSQFPYEHCVRSTLADGSKLTVTQGFENAVDRSSPQRWLARLITPSGRQVDVVEWSPVGTSNLEPPVSIGDLRRIATSTEWTRVIDTLPEPKDAAAPSVPLMPGSRILDTVESMLPRALRTAHQQGAEKGYATLTVDDGSGPSLLAVTVMQWKPGSPQMVQVFSKAKVRPDGSRHVTRQNPVLNSQQKSVSQWEADVLYRDGLRVTVSEINAIAYGLPATRNKPLLPVARLAAIALRDEWKS
jgi:hypothetical protein